MLVAQGLIARGPNLNEVFSCKPLVFSCQSRTVSTAQEKANTRAMLDRMLRFRFQKFKRNTNQAKNAGWIMQESLEQTGFMLDKWLYWETQR